MGKADDSITIGTYALLTESETKDHPTEWSEEVIWDMAGLYETNVDDPRTKVLVQQLSYYYLPAHPEEIIRLGKRFAFAERGKQQDLQQDIADIY